MPITNEQAREAAPSDPPDDYGDGCESDGGGDDSHDNGNRWITVASFDHPTAADIARLLIESHEIDCILINKNFVAMDWLMANAMGGIKIQVRESDAAEARRLLDERASSDPDDDPQPIQTEPPAGTLPPVESDVITCPECGSTHVVRPWLSMRTMWAAVVALLLAGIGPLLPVTFGLFVVYLLLLRPWKCCNCGEQWTRERTPHGFDVNRPETTDDSRDD